MERYAKGFRSFGGFLILLELVSFFLPITERIQAGYATLRWSQFQYVKAMLEGAIPYTEESTIPATTAQMAIVLCCMAVPLLLAVAAGLWGLFGSPRQRGSSILTFIILILYIVLGGSMHMLWPDPLLTQTYEMGIACTAGIAISGCSAVMAILSLASTPKKIRQTEAKIPQVQEIRQQQAEARYNIIMEEAGHGTGAQRQEAVQPETPAQRAEDPYIPGQPRGVMVGLTGIYAGAELPLPDGEFIKLGRQKTNNLIFEGQGKVSRDHCKIKWDAAAKKYIICDYSSTGSFVNGSRDCLPQNLELMLEPGTVVAIGDATNTFRLE